jgi:hypothetical protein
MKNLTLRALVLDNFEYVPLGSCTSDLLVLTIVSNSLAVSDSFLTDTIIHRCHYEIPLEIPDIMG